MNALSETISTETTRPRLRPRRTLNRLALAMLAVVVGLLGQGLLRQDSLWDGLLLLGVAVLLFVRAVGRALPGEERAGDPYQGLDRPLGIRSGAARVLGLAGFGLALLFSILAYRAFGDADTLPRAWDFYLASLAFLLIGTLLLTQGESFWHLLPQTPAMRWLLVLVFGLAFFMRFWRFDSVPFGTWYDEAISGLQAVRWNTEPLFRPQFEENNPGQLIFLFATALRWLGRSTQALRLVQVLLGLAGVLAAYFFGRELRGPRFGLALAFFVAVARWHVNFSRIAMPGIDTPLFEFLSLLFLMHLMRRGSLRDAVWAGVSLGFGLSAYSAFRLFVLTLGLFAILAFFTWRAWWSRIDHRDWWLKLAARLAMVALAVWLTALPVVHFAQNEPTSFWWRVQKTAIFNIRDEPDLPKAIWGTTRLHLLMFNFHGDNNGRHNLPGEPMLDPVMGVLFVLGLGVALVRWRQPANLFFLILLPTALMGGALSLDFEAPQSLRSIAVLPAVFYFCALSLAVLGRQAEQSLRPVSTAWLVTPVLVFGGYVFFFNAHTYFVRQAEDFASWHAFSTAESITAQRMADLGPDYIFYLSPFLSNHPAIRFLSPDTPDQRILTLPDPLPIRQPADRPAALFIHPDDAWIYGLAQTYYLSGEFETIFDPHDETPVIYEVVLGREDIALIQGLELRYWSGQAWAGPPQSALRVGTLDVSWPEQAPLAGDEGTAFAAEWSGTLYAPEYGQFQFILSAPASAWLDLDGNKIAEVADSGGPQNVWLNLAQGNHRLQVRALSGVGQVRLSWQRPGREIEPVPQWALYSSPVTNHGLQGNYYANATWAGLPTLSRIDPFLDIYFHLTPLPRPYTVEWTGVLNAPLSGVYALGLRAVDWAELYLDGQLVVQARTPDVYAEGTVQLNQGLHDLRLRFKDTMPRSRLHLYWRPPGQDLQVLASEYLWPPQGNYPAETVAEPLTSFEAAPLRLVPLKTLGGAGSQLERFLEPRDVAVGLDGRLYVADTGNRRVQVFSPAYEPLAAWTEANGQSLAEPLALAISGDGEVLVLDSTAQWVYRFSPDGDYLGKFGGPEVQWFHPRGLTVFDDGTIAVVDTGNGRVSLFNADGFPLGALGTLGSGPGQFIEPVDVARDPSGTYFVTEGLEMHRLQRLDAFGAPLAQWSIPSTVAFDGAHLAWISPFDSENGRGTTLLVTSSAESSLLRYNLDGTLVEAWQAIGPVTFQQPVGVFVDDLRQRLYVTDVGTHQVHIFEIEYLAE